MTYKASVIKLTLERILIYPFVLLGKFLSPIFFIKEKHTLIVFSPAADIGGSIQNTIDLCKCLADKNPLVIFSKKPKNNKFLEKFVTAGIPFIDLHKYVDYKLYHFVNFFYRGVIASYINSIEMPIVVGGESLFFYKVLPFIKPKAMRVDVCHLNTWFNYTQALIKYLDARIFSSKKIKQDAEELYKKNNLSKKFFERLYFIDNKVDIPSYKPAVNDTLSVVFIGRGAPQKRVYLIAAIAKKTNELNINIRFSFAGDVEKIFNPADYPFATFYGNISDKKEMDKIQQSADVLLLTSAYEGLPMAVMEMMAYGKVIVSTAVGAIPDYIINEENGFLLKDSEDENEIIEEAVDLLKRLVENKYLLKEVGENSRLYAEQHFSGDAFCKEFRTVLLKKAIS